MVFIHGGGYNSGATNDPAYDGYNLINKYEDVILITISYRLNILGFINLSLVTGGEKYKSSTNLGLLDQICALKWIQKNIEKFGGDPKKITVFGESAGGSSAVLLPLIDDSKNLFQRIISESGSLSLTFSMEESEKSTKELLKKSGASNMEDLLALSEDEIKKIHNEISSYDCFAIRDGYILPEDLYEGYKSGKGKDIDMLLGSNKDETRYFILSIGEITNYFKGKLIYSLGLPILYDNYLKKMSSEDKKLVDNFMQLQTKKDKKIWKITEFFNEIVFRVPMNKLSEYHSDAGGNTYVYIWKFPGKDETLGACHTIELPYVFNNDFDGDKILNTELVNNTQDMWVNFARNGNPSTDKFIWEKYDSDGRKTMILDEKIEMGGEYKSEQRKLIEPLLKYYFNGVSAQMSYNVPQTYKIVAQFVTTLGIIVLIFGIIGKKC
jgi:para-nitrobenzyl esterase